MASEAHKPICELKYEQLWAEEAEARYEDFLAGRTIAIDGDEVFARARNRFGPQLPKGAEDP